VLYQAERLLCGRKGDVLLFHAWNPDAPDFESPTAAEDYLRQIQARLASEGARGVRIVLRRGPLGPTLAATVEAENVSLVAMSTHGRETSPHLPIAGAVGELLRDVRVPLYVARAFRPGSGAEPLPAECEAPSIRRVLVPLDGSTICEAVMPYAKELGQLLGARIIILHVSPDEGDQEGSFVGNRVVGGPHGPAPGASATEADRIEYAAHTFSAAGLETLTLTMGGDPTTTILDFARPSAVDLIAMTTHGRNGLSKLILGSVADKVLKEGVLPTLLVRSDAPAAPCLPP
jgi:nucleotide-binding universal stress UspA family protein